MNSIVQVTNHPEDRLHLFSSASFFYLFNLLFIKFFNVFITSRDCIPLSNLNEIFSSSINKFYNKYMSNIIKTIRVKFFNLFK